VCIFDDVELYISVRDVPIFDVLFDGFIGYIDDHDIECALVVFYEVIDHLEYFEVIGVLNE